MDFIGKDLQEATWIFWAGYFSIGFFVWYLFNGLEAWLNGGNLGRGKWWVFSCVYEEMLELLPGGKMRIQRRLQQMMCPVRIRHGIITREYQDLEYYEADACKMTRWPRHVYFWGVQMFGTFFLWPVLVSSLLLIIAFNNLFYNLYLLFKWLAGQKQETD